MAQFKLGRRPFIAPRMAMKFGDYQKKTFPTPPPAGDYFPRSMTSINKVYLNETYGDCVIAWMAHAIGIFTSNADGGPVTFSDDQIIQMYTAIGGFDPANPQQTDNGCDENTAINYWQDPGFLGHKIQGVLSVDATNESQCQDAVWLFENLMFGIGLPDAYVNPFPSASGFVWDVAGESVPTQGHCFGAGKWGPEGLGISTWGMIGTITYPAVAKYAVPSVGGELFTVITQEILDKGLQKSPAGFDWGQLVVDFNNMGGNLTV